MKKQDGFKIRCSAASTPLGQWKTVLNKKGLKTYILSEKSTEVNLIFISSSFQLMTSGHVYEEVKGVFFNRISTVVRIRVLDIDTIKGREQWQISSVYNVRNKIWDRNNDKT